MALLRQKSDFEIVTHTLWHQFKGTKTLFPFSRAVVSPTSRPLCIQAKWSVNFIELLVPDLGGCLLFRDESQLSVWFMPHMDLWLWLQSGQKINSYFLL